MTLLYKAAKEGDITEVRRQLEQGIDSDKLNHTLLEASGAGHSDVVKLLLDNGAWVNFQDIDESSSLIVASQNGHSDVVKLLLDNGAQVNLQNNDESSSLIVASHSGHGDVVKLLLDNGAQIDLKNKDGFSTLDLTSTPEVIQLLVSLYCIMTFRNLKCVYKCMCICACVCVSLSRYAGRNICMVTWISLGCLPLDRPISVT